MDVFRNGYDYIAKYIAREWNYYRVRPTNALVYLTYRCTSHCKSCSMWKRKVQENEMSLDEWKRFVDMITPLGIRNMEMFGGDALLRKDVLFPLTEYAKKKGIPEIDLVTNCLLMDEETANRIIETGISVLYISVDGTGELHDNVRGTPGAFEKVAKSIASVAKKRRRLNSRTPRIVINCTVSALNYHAIDKILDFANESGADKFAFEYVGQFPKKCLKNSAINGIEPQPYYLDEENSIRLSTEQALLLKRKLYTIKANSRNLNVYFNSLNIDVLSVENMVSGVLPNKRCYISRYLIIADPYGNIIPCPFHNNYVIGNVRQQPFRNIWNNKQHQVFMEYVDKGKCEMCRYCILGVERNPTPLQALRKQFSEITKRGVDERRYVQ